MSGQNIPDLSNLSFQNARASAVVIIKSDAPGIKATLMEFFSGAKLFAKIQRIGDGFTIATVQGSPELLNRDMTILKETLLIQYEAEMELVDPNEELTSITIEDTSASSKRDPSTGEFCQKEFEEISAAASAHLKKFAKNVLSGAVGVSTNWAVGKGLITIAPEKHIKVKYRGQIIILEISTVKSVEKLLQKVQDYGSDYIDILELSSLQNDCLYYALDASENLPKKVSTMKRASTMDEFYEKLKIESDVSDSQIVKAKKIFSKQDGDLAMTDGKLEKCGISQMGLRTAILAVIRDSQ